MPQIAVTDETHAMLTAVKDRSGWASYDVVIANALKAMGDAWPVWTPNVPRETAQDPATAPGATPTGTE